VFAIDDLEGMKHGVRAKIDALNQGKIPISMEHAPEFPKNLHIIVIDVIVIEQNSIFILILPLILIAITHHHISVWFNFPNVADFADDPNIGHNRPSHGIFQ
jgi:hypothetical protein